MPRGAKFETETGVEIRTAEPADLDGLTALLTEAFKHDPLWRWAFAEDEGLATWWRFYIESALRYPCIWIAGDFAAAAVWIPPGGVELTDDEEQRVEPLLRKLVGPRAPQVMELLERFEAAHPRDEPHYYLSLLGTAERHRGRGLGMALLAENLRRIDGQGKPAYLESSNPANNRRYERMAFHRTGEFKTPDDTRTVATMWREPTTLGAEATWAPVVTCNG
jgi:ribosomal protein S18 acetylase RimI-like enzyme